ncbi:hypothetical protein Tco_0435878 [Tanacetum coccineum]
MSPPLSPITSPGISPSHLLSTPKTTPPPLTSPPPAPSQPSKQTSSLAINLDPIEIIFSTPPTSPHPFFDSLEDLPPRTTNLPPPQPSLETIERLTNQPPPLPTMEPPLPPIPPHLPPLVPNNPFPVLTHKMFCDHCQRTQVIVNDLLEEMRSYDLGVGGSYTGHAEIIGQASILGEGQASILKEGQASILGEGQASILGEGQALILGEGQASILKEGPASILGEG